MNDYKYLKVVCRSKENQFNLKYSATATGGGQKELEPSGEAREISRVTLWPGRLWIVVGMTFLGIDFLVRGDEKRRLNDAIRQPVRPGFSVLLMWSSTGVDRCRKIRVYHIERQHNTILVSDFAEIDRVWFFKKTKDFDKTLVKLCAMQNLALGIKFYLPFINV